MKNKIGIIGINGRFGQMLEGFFERQGYIVIGSDPKNPAGPTNMEVVEKSDAVIFSVPVSETPTIIRSVLPAVREDQLLMDITSIKQPAVEAMLESNAQVVGLHPMFRPDMPFDGQTVVACAARLTDPEWRSWVFRILNATGARIKHSTPAEHDETMLTIQVMPHLSNLINALLIVETGVSVSESLTFASPFYRVMFSQMGRLVSQAPDLYTSIIMENPGTVEMLERRIAIEQRLLDMIKNKDQKAFEGLFSQGNEYFGPEVTKDANELFQKIVAVLSTPYG